jgi:hypothetical protein
MDPDPRDLQIRNTASKQMEQTFLSSIKSNQVAENLKSKAQALT